MPKRIVHPSFDKTTHGLSRSRTYKSWQSMKSRCLNINAPDYDRYGGKGITVHKEWINSFETFYSDMGERPEKMSLDRADNSVGYTPENCRWVSPKRQSRNRDNNRLLTLNGITHCCARWSEITGLSQETISARINALGWSDERALTQPCRVTKTSGLV